MTKDKKTDYRTFYERDYIGAWDLQEKDVTVTIESAQQETVTGPGGRKDQCLVIRMEGKKKGFVCNITNARTIAKQHGKYVEDWIGKQITVYATTTQFGGDVVDCIRVRGRARVRESTLGKPPPDAGDNGGFDPETGVID